MCGEMFSNGLNLVLGWRARLTLAYERPVRELGRDFLKRARRSRFVENYSYISSIHQLMAEEKPVRRKTLPKIDVVQKGKFRGDWNKLIGSKIVGDSKQAPMKPEGKPITPRRPPPKKKGGE